MRVCLLGRLLLTLQPLQQQETVRWLRLLQIVLLPHLSLLMQVVKMLALLLLTAILTNLQGTSQQLQ
jgi:hypothetical protein